MRAMARNICGWVRQGYNDWLRHVVFGTDYQDLTNTPITRPLEDNGFHLSDGNGFLAVKPNSEGLVYVASGFHEFAGFIPGKLYVVTRGHASVQDFPDSLLKAVFSHPESKARGLKVREAVVGIGTTLAYYGEPTVGAATAAAFLGVWKLLKLEQGEYKVTEEQRMM